MGTYTKVETFFAGNLDEVPAIHVRLVSSSALEFFGVIYNTYLLAQMRAASRASELNCSYSLETM